MPRYYALEGPYERLCPAGVIGSFEDDVHENFIRVSTVLII